jgi:Icc protein
MPEPGVRILQVTDCHILPGEGDEVYGTDTYRSLQAVLRAALALAQPPERIIATGDLSEDGADASYARLRDLLRETGLPVNVIPGNHDSPEAMRRSLLCDSVAMVPTLDLEGWRVAFLNSQVPGHAHGYLDEAELQLLTLALDEAPGRSVVTCLHHSPIPPCPSRGCHLHNDDQLLELLAARPNARLVLAGHAHLESNSRLGHTTFLTTPASSSQASHAQQGDPVDHEDFWASHAFDPSRHGFRMLTLKPGGRFETQVHWVD